MTQDFDLLPELSDASMKQKGDDAFRRWGESPEVKMLISLLPPLTSDQQRDCFAVILKSCFDRGFDAGQGSMAGGILRSMMAAEGRKKP